MSNKNFRTLITVPNLTLPGGVAALFNLLKLNSYEGIEYFNVNFFKGKWSVLFLPIVYIKFSFKMFAVRCVHLNPSLDAKSFYRDMVFAFIAKGIFRRKTIVYWHGWQNAFFQKVKNSSLNQFFFRNTFAKADVHIVLAKEFGKGLQDLGYQNEIILESNVTEKVKIAMNEKKELQQFNLLFISRITEGKGWDIAINTMRILSDQKIDNVHLTIAGDGECLNAAKDLASKLKLSNVRFTGYVNGQTKEKLLQESAILFFPTCYGEGMPITILEGMMHGMPIISRNVGGIPDHIANEINGFLTDSTNPEDFAKFIIQLTKDSAHYKRMSEINIEKANREFVPERLTATLLKIYQQN